MSKSKIHICICDRCEETKQAKEEYDTTFYRWGHVWYAQNNGHIYVKSRNMPNSFKDCFDLCEECMKELNDWYNKPKTGKF